MSALLKDVALRFHTPRTFITSNALSHIFQKKSPDVLKIAAKSVNRNLH